MANQWIMLWMIMYTQLVLASTQPLLLVPVKNVVQPFFSVHLLLLTVSGWGDNDFTGTEPFNYAYYLKTL